LAFKCLKCTGERLGAQLVASVNELFQFNGCYVAVTEIPQVFHRLFPTVLTIGVVIFDGVEPTLEIPKENPYNRNMICEL